MKHILIKHSNGQWVMVGAVQSAKEKPTLVILGTLDSRDKPLKYLSDFQIVEVLTACSDIGKILESKGFKVIY